MTFGSGIIKFESPSLIRLIRAKHIEDG